jgi:hypothetical protein
MKVVLEKLQTLRLRAHGQHKRKTKRRYKAAAGAGHRYLLHPHVGGNPRAKEAGVVNRKKPLEVYDGRLVDAQSFGATKVAGGRVRSDKSGVTWG